MLLIFSQQLEFFFAPPFTGMDTGFTFMLDVSNADLDVQDHRWIMFLEVNDYSDSTFQEQWLWQSKALGYNN